MRVYTIGHSNKPLDDLLARLRRHGIRNLIDVRSIPRSRYNPQFDLVELRSALPFAEISYRFEGHRLGGMPGDPALLTGGRPDYEKIRRSDDYAAGIRSLTDRLLPEPPRLGASVLMCSEQDPSRCHRRRLVGADLVDLGVEVLHVMGDGSVRTEHEVREAMGENEPNVIDLFRPKGT